MTLDRVFDILSFFSILVIQDQMLHEATTLGTRALSYARRNT